MKKYLIGFMLLMGQPLPAASLHLCPPTASARDIYMHNTSGTMLHFSDVGTLSTQIKQRNLWNEFFEETEFLTIIANQKMLSIALSHQVDLCMKEFFKEKSSREKVAALGVDFKHREGHDASYEKILFNSKNELISLLIEMGVQSASPSHLGEGDASDIDSSDSEEEPEMLLSEHMLRAFKASVTTMFAALKLG